MIGEKIKKKRLELNMTQDYLADKLAISRQAVSKWEKGLSEPSMENLEKLSEVFGVDLGYFKNESKDEKRDPVEEFKQKPWWSRLLWYGLYLFIGLAFFGMYYGLVEGLLEASTSSMPWIILTLYLLAATTAFPQAIVYMGEKLSDIEYSLFSKLVLPGVYVLSPLIIIKYIVDKER